jgi:hypothetical protein
MVGLNKATFNKTSEKKKRKRLSVINTIGGTIHFEMVLGPDLIGSTQSHPLYG